MENIYKKMEQYLKVHGKMINNMEKVLNYGEIQQNMKENILKEKNKEMDY